MRCEHLVCRCTRSRVVDRFLEAASLMHGMAENAQVRSGSLRNFGCSRNAAGITQTLLDLRGTKGLQIAV